MQGAGGCPALCSARGCDGLSPNCTTADWVSRSEVSGAAGKKMSGFI